MTTTIHSILEAFWEAATSTVVPVELRNSEKLNNSLNDIDHAMDAHQYRPAPRGLERRIADKLAQLRARDDAARKG